MHGRFGRVLVPWAVLCALMLGCDSTPPAAPSSSPDPNSVTIEVRGEAGATGSGVVSVYYPSFQPGAQHVGTCVVEPGSATCTYTIDQTTGTLELVANGVTGSTFTAWGIDCASESSNACVVSIPDSSAHVVSAIFSVPTTPVTIPVAISLEAEGTHQGVLRSSHGHAVELVPLPAVIPPWEFDMPVTGTNVRLEVEPDVGSAVTFFEVTFNLLQGNVTVCSNLTPAETSCTFAIRPNELFDSGSLLQIRITLDDPPPAAPPLPPSPPPPGSGLFMPAHSLRWGFVGIEYDASFLSAVGGTPPYQYAVSAGLPPGVSYLDGPVGRRFGGTPQAPGAFGTIVTVTDVANNTATATVNIPVAQPSVVNGTWRFTIAVTDANGPCSDEIGEVATNDITIAGAAGLSSTFVASGFLGVASNTLTGSFTEPGGLQPNRLPITLEGRYPEDGGETVTTHLLGMATPTRMVGDEIWGWGGPGGVCTGRAFVEAVKLP